VIHHPQALSLRLVHPGVNSSIQGLSEIGEALRQNPDQLVGVLQSLSHGSIRETSAR
jgi:hypothetical protein